MGIETENFKIMYCEDEIPSWSCPHCNKGTLNVTKEGFRVLETAETLRGREEIEHEPDWDRGNFVCRMVCSNSKCAERLVFNGEAGVDYNGTIEVEDGHAGYINEYAWFITPKYFSKPIKLFQFQNYYPKDILPTVERAFGLLWYDPASCANKIRTAIELILDERGETKFEIVTIKKQIKESVNLSPCNGA